MEWSGSVGNVLAGEFFCARLGSVSTPLDVDFRELGC